MHTALPFPPSLRLAPLFFVAVAVLLVRESEKLRLPGLICLLPVFLEIQCIWFPRHVIDSRHRHPFFPCRPIDAVS
jgi:hypothetical protein